MMDAQSQLLIYGVLPEHKIYGGRTRKGWQTGTTTSTPEGVPLPSYRYGKETRGTHRTIPQKE
ncbi:hypothetical protein B4N90_13145 [Acinetobacter baumannii]|nr:hypothetical protein B4N90_13145 [Acinetobacter baumannii]